MPTFYGSPREQIRAAKLELGITTRDLWVRYFGVGGNAAPEDFGDYVDDGGSLTDDEVRRLVAALNDEFTARGENHPVDEP